MKISAGQVSQLSVQLQEMIQVYNLYRNEYRNELEQWEDNLKAQYKNRLLKVGVRGIEDMGIMDSYRNIKIEEHQSGNFILIMVEEGSPRGYIFPFPGLYFNSTTLTEQLIPFYNLPCPTSEGIIEKIEQPAYVEKSADGLWEVVKKGKIRFKGEAALSNSISGTSATKSIPAMIYD